MAFCLRVRTSVVLRHKTLVFESAVIESRRSEGVVERTPRDSDGFAASATMDNDDFFDDSVMQEGAGDTGEDVLPVPVRRVFVGGGRVGGGCRHGVVQSCLSSLHAE